MLQGSPNLMKSISFYKTFATDFSKYFELTFKMKDLIYFIHAGTILKLDTSI